MIFTPVCLGLLLLVELALLYNIHFNLLLDRLATNKPLWELFSLLLLLFVLVIAVFVYLRVQQKIKDLEKRFNDYLRQLEKENVKLKKKIARLRKKPGD